MENLVDRVQQLEMRTRKMEAQLWRWRIAVLSIGLAAVGLGFGLRSEAQQQPPSYQQQPPYQQQPYQQAPAAPAGTVVNAPFTVKGSDGSTLLTITEYQDTMRKGNDSLLTFYRNGLPAALFRTTGMTYRQATDSKDNFLNVIETWLYRYPDKASPVPYLAASTALTRSGGSLVVFNEQGAASTTPPFAARLTAQQGIGGRLVLFNPDGKEAKVIDPK